MLQYMRKNANSKLVWVIIGAIGVVFVFFGVGSNHGQAKKITVNGEEIGLHEYNRMHQEVARTMQNQAEADSAGIGREINRRTTSYLVRQTLVRQFAREAGLMPSDQAVAKRIAEIPEFQTDGRFDSSRYHDALTAGRMDPSAFENDKRYELLAGRVSDLVGGLARVYRPEVVEMFHFQEDRVRLDYAFFPATGHRAGLSPTDEQLTAFYALNQEKWREPAKMTMEYVDIQPSDFLDKVTFSDDELRRHYEENKERFTRPESAEVSHIFFKFPQMNPTVAEKEATLARAEAARKRADTEDFAALARELSDDPGSAPMGGSLGSIGRGMTFDQFEKAIFSLPLNETSQPVATDIGYHLIRVTGRQEAGLRPFEEVRDTLADEQKAFKAREMAVAQLEDLIVRAETSKLADAAASLGFKAETTPMFTQAALPDFLEADQAAGKKVFSAPVGRVADPLELAQHLVLFAPLERQESRIPELAQVRPAVTEAWIAEEAGRLAQAEASKFIEEARAKGWAPTLAALPESAAVKSGEGELSPRSGLVSTRPFERVSFLEFVAAVYSLGATGEISPLTVPGDLNEEPGAFAVILAEVQPADESQLDGSTGESFASLLNRSKANLMFQVWDQELYEASRDAILVPQEYME